jgi:opacity protein-like surface antigen
MKRMVIGVAALAAGLVVSAAPARAQGTVGTTGTGTGSMGFSIFGGGAFPTGDLGEGLNLGFRLGGGLALRSINFPLGLNVNLAYDRFGGDDDIAGTDLSSESLGIWSGSADVVWQFPTDPAASFRPFLDGGVGLYRIGGYAGGDSQTKFGFQIGGGVDLPLGGLATFVEAKYVSMFTEGKNSNFIPIVIGLRFGATGAGTTTSGHRAR